MSPKHPLARDPNGSSLAFWAGIILVLTLIYSLRFTPPTAGPMHTIPAGAPAQQAQAGSPAFSTGMTPPPLPADAPIPRTEERIPVVTAGDKPPVVIPTQFSVAGTPVSRTIPAWWQVATSLPAVNSLLVAPDGLVWAATEGGLARINAGQAQLMTPEEGSFPVRPATALAHDGTSLWIGSFDGLFKSSDGRRFQRYTAADGLAHDMIWSLHWDGAILWVGTQNGVSFLLPNGQFETVTKKISNGGLADLWIGSIGKMGPQALCGNDDGLSIWDTRLPAANPSAWKTIDMFSTNLAHNWILSLAVSARGALWAATPGGLCRLRTSLDQVMSGMTADWEVFNRSRGLPVDRVDAVLPVGDDLWAGCTGGLARIRNGSTRMVTTADGLLASDVRALAASSGTVWIGTSAGVQALALDLFDR